MWHPKPFASLTSGFHGAQHHDDVDPHPARDNETERVPFISAEPAGTSSYHFFGRTKNTLIKAQRIISGARFVDTPLLLGTLLACFLFGLIVLSYTHPEQLQEFASAKGSRPSPITDEAVKTIPSPPIAPLHPSEYVSRCRKLNSGFMSHGDYWDEPPMDMGMDSIHEAVEETSEKKYKLPEGIMCSKSITYLLDGEVGLLADLALISQASALARERNRTFFIDDTYWNRGKWTDYFQDNTQYGPEPGCRAPYPKDLVACPRTASHWVITAHTAKYHFGHAFSDHYEDPYAHDLKRLRPIFDAARESFVSSIRLDVKLDALIESARHELKTSALSTTSESYVSVHVRRGDRKHRFSTTPYTPVSEYISYISNTQIRLQEYPNSSPVFFASDSPIAEREFAAAYPGPYFSLRQSQDPALRRLASSREYDQKEFNDLSLEERSRSTKGMIVDFALLSGMWAWGGDPVPRAGICTISSNVCKMMAVGLGWDRAFGKVDEMGQIDEDLKGWVEVEEKGKIVPIWTAFELF